MQGISFNGANTRAQCNPDNIGLVAAVDRTNTSLAPVGCSQALSVVHKRQKSKEEVNPR